MGTALPGALGRGGVGAPLGAGLEEGYQQGFNFKLRVCCCVSLPLSFCLTQDKRETAPVSNLNNPWEEIKASGVTECCSSCKWCLL